MSSPSSQAPKFSPLLQLGRRLAVACRVVLGVCRPREPFIGHHQYSTRHHMFMCVFLGDIMLNYCLPGPWLWPASGYWQVSYESPMPGLDSGVCSEELRHSSSVPPGASTCISRAPGSVRQLIKHSSIIFSHWGSRDFHYLQNAFFHSL